jgi:thiamine-phosphate pyrophosphorylase
MSDKRPNTRIFLITPPYPFQGLAEKLEQALKGGDIACLLIDMETDNSKVWEETTRQLCAIAQPKGVAVLVKNESRIAGRAKADGIHVDRAMDAIEDAMDRLKEQDMIVGASGLETRHNAMRAGELGVDYVFFGRLDKPSDPETHQTDFDMAEWWVSLFTPPCVVMAGSDLASIDDLVKLSVDFIALREAIWDNPQGPEQAIKESNEHIANNARQHEGASR